MLTPIAPENINTVWAWVRPGIQKIIDRTQESFLPEDVYLKLKQRQAYLYVVEERGFYVFERIMDADGTQVLSIWLCQGHLAHLARQLFTEIDALGRAVGASKIRWMSPRKGWEKFAKLTHYVYERKL